MTGKKECHRSINGVTAIIAVFFPLFIMAFVNALLGIFFLTCIAITTYLYEKNWHAKMALMKKMDKKKLVEFCRGKSA